ncbi:NCS1 family nucleobase:cation symporter-1 [Leekyejoonella antrihumi]|uniref:NCS1 family nucleobase:cation symporter-1 n=1 Tax=Leekyejoonella antrihumi TaxID=1660198 RepID=A0A563DTI0_9MICO|nr:NCS1 family nucleobase:cation symporter-1 [Leekyejoonella antrihumi]TWP33232.1 NCS1 family nucleobase:cation symporter-1 [Leekyejoonella antrihumi]
MNISQAPDGRDWSRAEGRPRDRSSDLSIPALGRAPSPRLYNPDIAPSTRDERRWGTYSLFMFWSNTAHNLGAYTFAAGLFVLGLKGWEVVVGILLASVVVYLGCRLSGPIGAATGVPFPVVSRLSWGVFGAIVPALIRAFAAIFWYGIQTYLASVAINAILLRFIPSSAGLQNYSFVGLDALSWISFVILWVVQLAILSRGMDIIRHVQGWSGLVIWALMIILGIYMLIKTGGHISLNTSTTHLSAGQQVLHTAYILGLIMGILATLMVNYADFTRFAPSQKSVRWGTIWGVPVNWTIFAVTSVVVSAGSLSLYGKVLLDPAEIFAKLSNAALLLVGALLLIVAAVGVNIVANFVSPAFDFSNAWPQKISFRTGGVITAIISLVSLPWKLYSTPAVINYFLGALGAMMGPLFAIMVVDYYLIKARKFDIDDMFSTDTGGRYYYRHGVNYDAVYSFVPAAVISIILAVVPAFSLVAPFSWYAGVLIAAALYYGLSRRSGHANARNGKVRVEA